MGYRAPSDTEKGSLDSDRFSLQMVVIVSLEGLLKHLVGRRHIIYCVTQAASYTAKKDGVKSQILRSGGDNRLQFPLK